MRSDDQIRDDVIAEIDWDPRFKSTEIGVTVKGGAVTLMGAVETFTEKLAAEQAAKKVKGIQAIAEDIEVVLSSSLKTSDEKIPEQIAHILQWNASISGDNIKAEVRNGFVTLSGEVDWNYQRETAKNLIAGVHGVCAVSNLIKLKSRVQQRDITREITRALHRDANLETSHIKVDVAGGKLTLKGDVKALVRTPAGRRRSVGGAWCHRRGRQSACRITIIAVTRP